MYCHELQTATPYAIVVLTVGAIGGGCYAFHHPPLVVFRDCLYCTEFDPNQLMDSIHTASAFQEWRDSCKLARLPEQVFVVGAGESHEQRIVILVQTARLISEVIEHHDNKEVG